MYALRTFLDERHDRSALRRSLEVTAPPPPEPPPDQEVSAEARLEADAREMADAAYHHWFFVANEGEGAPGVATFCAAVLPTLSGLLRATLLRVQAEARRAGLQDAIDWHEARRKDAGGSGTLGAAWHRECVEALRARASQR
jgi:hypothetical protein